MSDDKKYVIVNVTQEQVIKEARNAFAATPICSCEKCFVDVCAIVLNQMKCKFVTSQKGVLLAKISTMNPQAKQELAFRIAEAIKFVSQNPKH